MRGWFGFGAVDGSEVDIGRVLVDEVGMGLQGDDAQTRTVGLRCVSTACESQLGQSQSDGLWGTLLGLYCLGCVGRPLRRDAHDPTGRQAH